MAVEVKLSKSRDVKREYPYLAIHADGGITLFTYKETGFNVNGVFYKVGYYCTMWLEDVFTPLSPSESITLRNV